MTEWIMKEDVDMDGVYCYVRKGVVIRCKDCIHFQKHTGKFEGWRFQKGDGVCKYHNYERVESEKDFCSRGKVMVNDLPKLR